MGRLRRRGCRCVGCRRLGTGAGSRGIDGRGWGAAGEAELRTGVQARAARMAEHGITVRAREVVGSRHSDRWKGAGRSDCVHGRPDCNHLVEDATRALYLTLHGFGAIVRCGCVGAVNAQPDHVHDMQYTQARNDKDLRYIEHVMVLRAINIE